MLEKISLEINGTPLIKFQSYNRIMDLRSGHLYAKNLSYYRQLEQEKDDVDIGDEFEAMIHVNEGVVRFPTTGEVVQLKDALIPTVNSDDYAFCMFGIYPNLKTFQFTDEQKTKMLSFGDTALIILDSAEFINRVKKTADNNGLTANFEAVNYYNPSIDSGNFLLSLLSGMWKVALWKRERYKYQQEARFVFSPGNKEVDHIDLDIGDISDITAVVSSEQALTAIVEAHH